MERGRASSTQPSHQRRRIKGPLPASSRLGLSPTRIVGTSVLLPTSRASGGGGGREGGDGAGGTNNNSAGLPEFESIDGTTSSGGDELVGFLPAVTTITNNCIDQGYDKTELNPIAAALAEAKKKEEVAKTEVEEKNKHDKEAATVITTTAVPPAFTFGATTTIVQEKKEEAVTEKPPQAPKFTFGSQPPPPPQQHQQQQAAAAVFSFGGGVQPSSDTAAAAAAVAQLPQQQPAPFSFTGSAALPGTIFNSNNIVFQAGGTQSGSQATSGGRRVVRSRRPKR